ncbi:MAG: hypothetical protein R3F37_12465 [Candidatus Competibacteraceae bacterium]
MNYAVDNGWVGDEVELILESKPSDNKPRFSASGMGSSISSLRLWIGLAGVVYSQLLTDLPQRLANAVDTLSQ